jgi:hypothetical protein
MNRPPRTGHHAFSSFPFLDVVKCPLESERIRLPLQVWHRCRRDFDQVLFAIAERIRWAERDPIPSWLLCDRNDGGGHSHALLECHREEVRREAQERHPTPLAAAEIPKADVRREDVSVGSKCRRFLGDPCVRRQTHERLNCEKTPRPHFCPLPTGLPLRPLPRLWLRRSTTLHVRSSWDESANRAFTVVSKPSWRILADGCGNPEAAARDAWSFAKIMRGRA